uniref:U4/U6.U5 small nuclear ribonucleoprotein 27 kDa protein n=1 Tax=Panagrolaimus sp. JU765 TaxID=591449 RepID=A0AC34QB29_9BILA
MSFYQKTGTAASGTDHRRKWDVNEYAAKANERLAEEREKYEAKNNKNKPKGPKVKRELLQAREEKVGYHFLIIFDI